MHFLPDFLRQVSQITQHPAPCVPNGDCFRSDDLFCSSPVDFSIFRSLELPNPLLREASQKDYRLKPRSCCVRYEQNADVMLCSE